MSAAVDYIRSRYREGLLTIPLHMRESMTLYVEHGIEPGSFGMSVLANDFKGAVGRADIINISALKSWAEFIMFYLPMNAQGSYEIVNAWCKSGGLSGPAYQEASDE